MAPMPLMEPVWWSWPCVRHLEQGCEKADIEGNTQLTSQQLAAWVKALQVEHHQLVITADSLRLLPQQLPYDLIGPMLLAAVDSYGIKLQHLGCQPAQLQHSAQQVQADARLRSPQQILQGLQLVSIDLQEPIVQPLRCCFEAYTQFQHLHLTDLNIDMQVAKALGSILHHSSQDVYSRQSNRCQLRSLELDGVYMCDLAWRAFAEGVTSGCGLQSLRISRSLTASSLALLATAIASGCGDLQKLELLHDLPENPSANTSSSHNAEVAADAAWVQLFQGLTQRCKRLQSLCLIRCSLGSNAAAHLCRLLQTLSLQQLTVQHCCGLGQGLLQLTAAAACCHSLKQLDVSSTKCTDAALKALTATRWNLGLSALRSKDKASGLGVLHVGGNSISGSFVRQVLAKQLISGLLSALTSLNMKGCLLVGDEGASALASVLSSGSCNLKCLDLSGCEITDQGAEALANGLVSTPVEAQSHVRNWGATASHHWSSSLLELRLSDNQFTAAGIQLFAKAISDPECRILLLDVSFNWVGPQAMQPLVTAAAERNVCTADTEQHISVLHECSPEYWRVEAAKAAAATMQDAPTVEANSESLDSLAGSNSCHNCCSCSSSSRSSQSHCATDVMDELDHCLRRVVQSSNSICLQQKERIGTDGTVWTFNSLFCNEGLHISGASSAIAAGHDDCSVVCKTCTGSDCMSDSSTGIPACGDGSSLSHMLERSAGSSISNILVESSLQQPTSTASRHEHGGRSYVQSAQLHQDATAEATHVSPAAEASAVDSTQSVDVDKSLKDVVRASYLYEGSTVEARRPHQHDCNADWAKSDQVCGLRDQQLPHICDSQQYSTSCHGPSSAAACEVFSGMTAGHPVSQDDVGCQTAMQQSTTKPNDSCSKKPHGQAGRLAVTCGVRSTADTVAVSLLPDDAACLSTSAISGLKTLCSMRCRVAAGQPGQCLSPVSRPRPPSKPCSNHISVQNHRGVAASGDGWCVVRAQQQVKAAAQASLLCKERSNLGNSVIGLEHIPAASEQDKLVVRHCLSRVTASKDITALPSVAN